MPGKAWGMVKDYAAEVKKKFSSYGDVEKRTAEGMAKQFSTLPDEEIVTLREGYPSNVHVAAEYKRRGLGKK